MTQLSRWKRWKQNERNKERAPSGRLASDLPSSWQISARKAKAKK
jgi:hypothetical protein